MSRPVFWKTTLSEVDAALAGIKRGSVKSAAKSAGGRMPPPTKIYFALF